MNDQLYRRARGDTQRAAEKIQIQTLPFTESLAEHRDAEVESLRTTLGPTRITGGVPAIVNPIAIK